MTASHFEVINFKRFRPYVRPHTFGGPKRNRLFITAGGSLYSLFVGQCGAQRP